VEARFSASAQTDPWAHPASYRIRTESSLGKSGWGVALTTGPPPNAEVKEREGLSVYPPLWTFMVVIE